MVLIIGGTTIDFIIRKEPIKKAEKIEIKEDELFFNIGGGGSNAAYILSYLGTKVYFLTKIGNDIFTPFLEDFFRRNSKIKLIKTKKEGRNSVSFIFDFEDRVIYTYRGASNHLKEEDILEELPDFEWLYITSNKGETINLVKKLIKKAKKENKKIFVNPSLYSVKEMKEEIQKSNLIILNKEEAFTLTGKEDIIESLNSLNKKSRDFEQITIITDGRNGVFFKKLGKYYHLKIDKVVDYLKIRPIDTTGAGDCFSATFFHFFVKRNFPLIKSLKLASLNAFNIIQKIGTKYSLKENELIKLLEKTKNFFEIEELKT